jgi:hypothetical protein
MEFNGCDRRRRIRDAYSTVFNWESDTYDYIRVRRLILHRRMIAIVASQL